MDEKEFLFLFKERAPELKQLKKLSLTCPKFRLKIIEDKDKCDPSSILDFHEIMLSKYPVIEVFKSSFLFYMHCTCAVCYTEAFHPGHVHQPLEVVVSKYIADAKDCCQGGKLTTSRPFKRQRT
jgi:hypothetical protein